MSTIESACRYLMLMALAWASTVQAAPQDVIRELQQRYDNVARNCNNSPSQPAFLCSGLLLRALHPSTAYLFYQPSPLSKANGGISVSYLRRDANFPKLAYELKSGVILDNVLLNPKEHYDPHYLCFFVIDGASEHRDNQGCGDSTLTPDAREGWCQDAGIFTADAWASDYRHKGADHSRQCAFDVRDQRNAAAGPAFYAGIQAMASITETYNRQNELRVATWPVDLPRSPSLLAAFYTEPDGLVGAQLYQRQWWQATGEHLPIVHLRLPQARGDTAQFSYQQSDQIISAASNPTASTQASCPPYIQSANWVNRTGIWSLEVTPTPCGRQIGESETEAFFQELQARHAQDSQWKTAPGPSTNATPSMRRQLVCHLQLHRNAPVWTLEPARVNTDNTTALSRNCDF